MLEDERSGSGPVDLRAVAGDAGTRIAWSQQSQDLNVNLVVLLAGQEIEPHRNYEVDVLIVGIDGEGTVVVGSETHELRAGQAILIEKGAQRGMGCGGSRFAYLTCHGQRRGLQPQIGSR